MTTLIPSAKYWQEKNGAGYRSQQEERRQHGNDQYAVQEKWLEDYIKTRSLTVGRPLKILDFGCGFGRFTRLFADKDFIEYYGYDFSHAMAEEIFTAPPAALHPIENRIRIASTIDEAFPDDKFDLIFTVSVLIHNPPEQARNLVLKMAEHLTSDGQIVLIENPLSALSARQNSWHAGCWTHDVAGTLAPEFNLRYCPDIASNHCFYVLTQATQQTRIIQKVDAQGREQVVALNQVLIEGLPLLEAGLKGVEQELELSSDAVGTMHDLAENNNYMKKRISDLEAKIEILEKDNIVLSDTLKLRAELRKAMFSVAEPEKKDSSSVQNHKSDAEKYPDGFYCWNAPQDQIFAHKDNRFVSVAHLFHREWKGIRAAAGTLPGNKIAISAHKKPNSRDISNLLQDLRENGIERIILHGMSDAMEVLAHALSKQGIKLCLVWHGTITQWQFPEERRIAIKAINLYKRGIIQRFSAIRRGFDDVIGGSDFTAQLVNAVPNYPGEQRLPIIKDASKKQALAPSWNDIRKNLYANVLAVEPINEIDKVFVFAKDLSLPKSLTDKVSIIEYAGPLQLPKILNNVDIVLNVTVIDCHPMVNLEALACNVPCLSGPLFLDVLEDHEYSNLTVVQNPLSVSDITNSIRNVFNTPYNAMSEIIQDYKNSLNRVAIDRYAEFVGV